MWSQQGSVNTTWYKHTAKTIHNACVNKCLASVVGPHKDELTCQILASLQVF